MNYYKRNLGDFARDTAHLSMGQIGAYDLMLDWYYANERPLPVDKQDVYRIARAFTKDEKKSVDKVLADFFTPTPGGWTQKRSDEELARYAKQRETNRVTGRKGGRPKSVTEQEPRGNRIGFDSLTEQEPNNNPNPESSNTEKAKAKPAPLAPVVPISGLSPSDVKAELWRRWKAMPDSGGGAYLAKLIRESGEQPVLEAVERTLDASPADPKGFIQGVLRKGKRAEDDYDRLMRSAL